MQRQLLLFTLLWGFVVSRGNAQNTSPFWSLAGNNNALATAKLGTTNAIPLNLTTNNATRLKIFEDGRTGVGSQITNSNATRVLNLADANAVMRILRVHASFAPSVELISRTSADGANVAYWDFYAEPSDKSFRIRDRVGGGSGLDRLTVKNNGYVGIGTTSPTAKLHLTVSGTNGYQGLGITSSNAGGKTLTINQGTPGRLNFTEPGILDLMTMDFITGRVGIGTTAPSSRLQVAAGYDGDGISVVGSALGPKDAAFTLTDDAGHNGSLGLASANNAFMSGVVAGDIILTNVGGKIHFGTGAASGFPTMTVSGSNVGIGTTAPAPYRLEVQGGNNTAIYSFSTNAHGIFGYSSNYHGVTGASVTSIGVYGIAYNANSYAGYFEGSVYTTGTYQGSDRKLKQNITDFSSAMDLISKLQPKAYEYRQDGDYKLMHLPPGKHFGLIAQDVEKVLPNLVKETRFDMKDGQPTAQGAAGVAKSSEVIDFKAVNYTELIPVLIKALQEQNELITELKKKMDKVAELEQQLADLKALITHNNSTTAITIPVYMEQNMPNPANGITTIQYAVPEGAGKAQLLLTDALGRIAKTIQLSTSGVVNIDTTTLASGVYTYSLVIEGKILKTKKLTVSR